MNQDTLMWCFDFMYYRDMMNAQVHCSPVRFSPLTTRLACDLDEKYQGISEFDVRVAQVLEAM